jgi:hypothetical protein
LRLPAVVAGCRWGACDPSVCLHCSLRSGAIPSACRRLLSCCISAALLHMRRAAAQGLASLATLLAVALALRARRCLARLHHIATSSSGSHGLPHLHHRRACGEHHPALHGDRTHAGMASLHTAEPQPCPATPCASLRPTRLRLRPPAAAPRPQSSHTTGATASRAVGSSCCTAAAPVAPRRSLGSWWTGSSCRP